MKTYHFTITDSKGNQVATCEIAHDGKHAGARKRAKAQAQAWKRREGYKGTITCRTDYGSNPEVEQSDAITALDKIADAYEQLGKRMEDATGAIAAKLAEINSAP